ncbi:cupin-like domain-containing protein [Francisella sciaenopsi]|uniref:JmjC domain-containing protein n=1 Tax=Francisella sciaenopsi TaxID=3055034 RepID=A0ABQ6PFB3_9GAMM
MENLKIDETHGNIAAEEFMQQYFDIERPLIIREFAKDWEILKKWDENYLRNALQKDPRVKSTKVYYTATIDFLKDDYELPSFILDLIENESSFKNSHPVRFWLNSRNNINHLHYDSNLENVFTIQVKGEKEWLLISPNTHVRNYPMSNFTIFNPMKNNLRNKHYYKITLNEGDLLYVPPLWQHMTTSKHKENININWTLTKKHTNTISLAFKREIERCLIHLKFKNSKFQKIYLSVNKKLPSFARVHWKYSSLTESSYKPSNSQLILRVFKELYSLIPAAISYPYIKKVYKNVDKVNKNNCNL